MERWRYHAMRWRDMVQRCHGAMTRWCDDDGTVGAAVRGSWCDDAMTMTRWCDSAMVWCNDVVVRWRWRDSAMVMVWWHDDTMVRELGDVREDSKAMLCRVIISICFIAPSHRVIEIFVLALFARKLWRQMLIFIRHIMGRVLSIPEKFIILTYCCILTNKHYKWNQLIKVLCIVHKEAGRVLD